MNHLRVNGIKINRARDVDVLDRGETAAYYVNGRRTRWKLWLKPSSATVSVVDLNAIVVDGILAADAHVSTLEILRAKFLAVAPEGIVRPENSCRHSRAPTRPPSAPPSCHSIRCSPPTATSGEEAKVRPAWPPDRDTGPLRMRGNRPQPQKLLNKAQGQALASFG